MNTDSLTPSEGTQIAEILTRRANEIAIFKGKNDSQNEMPGSVELALEREIGRLRKLAGKVSPPKSEPEDEE